MPSKLKQNIFISCIFFLFGFLVYSNVLKGSFQLDDHIYILNNTAIKHISDIAGIWSFWPTRFLTTLSFSINYFVGGFNAFGYHVVNVILHILSSIFLWRLTYISFETPAIEQNKIFASRDSVSIFAGLIFLSHPIQTEAVSYIVQRAASLSGLLCILCVYFFARSRLNKGGKLFSFLSIAAAIFAKENAIILPFLVILYDIIFFPGEKLTSYLRRSAPFFVIAAVMPMVMLYTGSVNFYEMRRSTEGYSQIPAYHYFATQCRVILTYIRLLFIPINQNIDYYYPIYKSLLQFPSIFGLTAISFIIFGSVKILPKFRLVSFAIFWFFIALIPESSFVVIADVIFEHRLYLPMAGFAIALSAAIYYLFDRYGKKEMFVTMLLVIAFYSALTYNRNFVWQSELSLWNDAVKKSPSKGRVYNNRGFAYLQSNELDNAVNDFKKAIELEPYEDAGYYYNLGNAYTKKGEFKKAIAAYDKAIAIKPDLKAAHLNKNIAVEQASKQ